MIGFTEFKNSIIANYELIVKALVGKLKKGDIVVAKAESANTATTAEKALEASTSLDASKLGGKTLADIIELLKNSSEQTFETLSQNLKGYNTKNDFYRENNSRGGFGLGLRIVKEICDKSLVIIYLDSNEKETKFTYRFKINEDITT
jgi:hypothetical protein